jgi:hypothetical protein
MKREKKKKEKKGDEYLSFMGVGVESGRQAGPGSAKHFNSFYILFKYVII